MPKSIVSRTETVYSTKEFDMYDFNDIELEDLNQNINQINEVPSSHAQDENCLTFDFKRYMYSIHYKLERKLVGTH